MIPLYIDFVNMIPLYFSIYSVLANAKHNLFRYFCGMFLHSRFLYITVEYCCLFIL
nr:MAG TPA: hypothetical protein [Caudoviricetes sp.]